MTMKIFAKRLFPFFLCLILFFGCSKQKKSHDFLIGIDPYWYPLEIAGREKNILAFSSELLSEIAKSKNIKIALITMNWDNLLWGLNHGKYEGILSSMQPYLFYEKKYQFSDLYLPTGPVLILPYDARISSLEKMKGKEVGVIRGSPASLLLQTFPGIILRSYNSIPETFNDILIQTIDGAVIDLLPAQAYVRDLYHNQLKIASPSLDNQGLRLITLQCQTGALIKIFNEGLKELRKSGKYEKMVKKWGLTDGDDFKVDASEVAPNQISL
ncbi:MAG: transporter substrate-binding domain-containing protein [Chlamydiae bacterium]|nr:transporter substrate-binding domain-containing protein [Chlamydiota bacterium]